jgi:hypothetical protein
MEINWRLVIRKLMHFYLQRLTLKLMEKVMLMD